MRTNELLTNYVNHSKGKLDYSRVWRLATIYEKAWIVLMAEERFSGIMGSVCIAVDLGNYPEWKDISEENQEKLNETMEDVISF